VNCTAPLDILVRNEYSDQLSHVNSAGRRKAEKATVKAALRLTSSYESLSVETIARSMSLVISPRSRIAVVPKTRWDPRRIRLMRGSSNTSVEIPLSTW
jgi:hypothetical protein